MACAGGGKVLGVPRHGVLELGRGNFPLSHPQIAQVSRLHCEISRLGAKALQLTATAQNPTVVLRVKAGEEVLIRKGETCSLVEGDKICLLKTDVSLRWEVVQRRRYSSEDTEMFSELMILCPSSDLKEVQAGESKRVPLAGSASKGTDESESSGAFTRMQPLPSTSKPVMLVLCGIPGSGKSTFGLNLCSSSSLWERVNQDSIDGGKRGTQQQCLSLASSILRGGRCPIIDRCNVQADQRVNFVNLAASLNVLAHAVVLNLPATLCADQAEARVRHEGGVEGPAARRVAFMMAASLKKHGMPLPAEGFSSVIVCESHKDIARALAVWKEQFESSLSPEAAFTAKGGGRGKIKSFFASKSKPELPVKGKTEPMAQAELPKDPDAAPASRAQHALASAILEKVPVSCVEPKGTPTALQERDGAGAAIHDKLNKGCPLKRKATASDPCIAASQTEPKRAAMQPEAAGKEPLDPGNKTVGDDSQRRDGVKPGSSNPKKDAFAAMMASAKMGARKGIEKVKGASPEPASRKALGSHWSNELRQIAQDPERERASHPGMVITEAYVIINDKYPKARLHGLAVARDPSLDSPEHLTAAHLPLLQKMEEGALHWILENKAKVPNAAAMRLGFHSVPSMRQLHLHIISQDLDSPCMKNKKHWNSFTTAFFLPLASVREQLQQAGRLSIDRQSQEDLLKGDLCCHRCRQSCKNMPTLKAHAASCPFPVAAQDVLL